MMCREIMRFLLVLSGVLVFTRAMADDRCLHEGDGPLFRAKTWSDLRRWRRDFPGCDDGYLGEGVSEIVTVSLSKR